MTSAATPPDWQISEDETGVHAVGPCQLTVAPGGLAFKRNGIKGVGGGNSTHVRWLVGELDGVRVYINGTHIVMTREDLNP